MLGIVFGHWGFINVCFTQNEKTAQDENTGYLQLRMLPFRNTADIWCFPLSCSEIATCLIIFRVSQYNCCYLLVGGTQNDSAPNEFWIWWTMVVGVHSFERKQIFSIRTYWQAPSSHVHHGTNKGKTWCHQRGKMQYSYGANEEGGKVEETKTESYQWDTIQVSNSWEDQMEVPDLEFLFLKYSVSNPFQKFLLSTKYWIYSWGTK